MKTRIYAAPAVKGLSRDNTIQFTAVKTHHYCNIILFVRPLHSEPGMKIYCWSSLDLAKLLPWRDSTIVRTAT